MKLSYQYRAHFKLCLQFLMGICMATIFVSGQAKADGVILIKSHPSQSPQYWRVFVFRESEASSFNYTVTLLNGLKQNFFRNEVGAMIEEPKWDEMIVVTDANWQKLEQQKAQLISSVAQYPQLKEWINKIIAKFDELLNSRSSSNVLYRGRLIAKEEFDKLSGNTSSPPSSSNATLTVGGKQFTNVKILSIKSGRLGFSHDGGMGGVQMSALDAKQIEWVKLTSPALFEAHLKELSMTSGEANQPSVSQSNAGAKMNSPSGSASESITHAQASTLAGNKKDILSKISKLTKEISDKFGLEDTIQSTQFPEKLFNEVKTFGEDIANGELCDITFTVKGKLSPTKFPNLYAAPVGLPDWRAVYEIIEHGAVDKTAILRVKNSDMKNMPNLEQGLLYQGFYKLFMTEEIEMKSGYVEEINFYHIPKLPQDLIIKNVEMYQELEKLKSLYDKLKDL